MASGAVGMRHQYKTGEYVRGQEKKASVQRKYVGSRAYAGAPYVMKYGRAQELRTYEVGRT